MLNLHCADDWSVRIITGVFSDKIGVLIRSFTVQNAETNKLNPNHSSLQTTITYQDYLQPGEIRQTPHIEGYRNAW